MTVKRKKDLDKVQTYIKKLAELKSFLEDVNYEETQDRLADLKVRMYWAK